MVLPLAVLGCIDHSALGQQHVHIRRGVFGALKALDVQNKLGLENFSVKKRLLKELNIFTFPLS